MSFSTFQSFRETAPASGTWIEHAALSIRTERDDELSIVELYGELDIASSEVAAEILRSCAGTDAEAIVVDLSGLDFIDSTGLQVLVECSNAHAQNGDRLRFLRGSDSVQRVFELTGLEAGLPFAD